MAKKEKPVNKTPELSKAKKALDDYLKENKLDPTKDWTKDKKHGKKITELVNKLNKERDKVAAKFPEGDEKNEAKLAKMKKKSKEAKEEKKKNVGRTATKYDYPLIDGREMTSAEKKKYRMEQRKLAAGSEKETDDKSEKKAKKKEKDTKTPAVEKKSSTKKKKVRKEED